MQCRRKLFYGGGRGWGGWGLNKNARLKKLIKPSNKQNLKINYLKSHISSTCFNFRFLSRESQSQQKLAIKITHFAIQFH